jgi:hypothetical protein
VAARGCAIAEVSVSQAVIVGVEVGPERLDVYSRLGASEGPALAFEAPPDAASPQFWRSAEFDTLLLELLALMHLPRIDTLVVALPGASTEQAGELLPRRCEGEHVVRNTECRSQTLTVTVRRVLVVQRAVQEEVARLAAAASRP